MLGGEYNLAAARFTQVVNDALGKISGERNKKSFSFIQREALNYIFFDQEFDFLCNILNIEPNYVRRLIHKDFGERKRTTPLNTAKY